MNGKKGLKSGDFGLGACSVIIRHELLSEVYPPFFH